MNGTDFQLYDKLALVFGVEKVALAVAVAITSDTFENITILVENLIVLHGCILDDTPVEDVVVSLALLYLILYNGGSLKAYSC